MTTKTVERNGVHPDLLPPQIEPGAMSILVNAGRLDSFRAGIAREPADMVTYTPASTFSLRWHDNVETFVKGIERSITPELADHLAATEQQHMPSADAREDDTVTVTPTADFSIGWNDKQTWQPNAFFHTETYRMEAFQKGVQRQVQPNCSPTLRPTGQPI
jgi:hypothetical protein